VSWGRKIIVLAVLIVLGFGLFRLFREKGALTGEVKKMRAQFESLTEENKDLAAKIEYFKNPANLLKEIKSQIC